MLTLSWLGINVFRFEYNGKVIWLDPYVTRSTEPLHSPELCQCYVPQADGIVISHSHWDHLADAHEIAIRTGAELLGSATTLNVCRALRVPEAQLRQTGAYETSEFCGASITFLPSLHVARNGKLAYAGSYEAVPETPPVKAPDYLEGGTFAVLFDFGGYRILDLGSANLEDEALRDLRVDLLLMGTGGWKHTERYPERLLSRVKADLIIPCHHDNFLRPLDAGIEIRERDEFNELLRKIKELAPDSRVHLPQFHETLQLG